eukprot:ctg_2108.g330
MRVAGDGSAADRPVELCVLHDNGTGPERHLRTVVQGKTLHRGDVARLQPGDVLQVGDRRFLVEGLKSGIGDGGARSRTPRKSASRRTESRTPRSRRSSVASVGSDGGWTALLKGLGSPTIDEEFLLGRRKTGRATPVATGNGSGRRLSETARTPVESTSARKSWESESLPVRRGGMNTRAVQSTPRRKRPPQGTETTAAATSHRLSEGMTLRRRRLSTPLVDLAETASEHQSSTPPTTSAALTPEMPGVSARPSGQPASPSPNRDKRSSGGIRRAPPRVSTPTLQRDGRRRSDVAPVRHPARFRRGTQSDGPQHRIRRAIRKRSSPRWATHRLSAHVASTTPPTLRLSPRTPPSTQRRRNKTPDTTSKSVTFADSIVGRDLHLPPGPHYSPSGTSPHRHASRLLAAKMNGSAASPLPTLRADRQVDVDDRKSSPRVARSRAELALRLFSPVLRMLSPTASLLASLFRTPQTHRAARAADVPCTERKSLTFAAEAEEKPRSSAVEIAVPVGKSRPSQMLVRELRDALRTLGADTTGLKTELVTRLEIAIQRGECRLVESQPAHSTRRQDVAAATPRHSTRSRRRR